MHLHRLVFVALLFFAITIHGLVNSNQSAAAWYQAECGTGEASRQTSADLGVPLGGPAKTGRIPSRSSFSEPVALWSLPAQQPGEPNQFTDPVFDGTSVWLVSDGKNLMKLDPLTGEYTTYEYEIPDVGAPVIADDAIILSIGDGSVSSFNIASGAGNWVATPGGIIIHLIVTNGIVVAVSASNSQIDRVFALDGETGNALWEADLLSQDGYPLEIVTSLTASEGIVVVASLGGLLALDEVTGQVCWATNWSQTFGGASAADGMVFADNGLTGKLAARDIRTGDLLWESDVDMGAGNPAVVDGTVYFGGRGGRLYAVAASAGETRWQSEAGDFSWAKPVVANTTVLAASADGLLYAFDATTGAPRWTFNVGGVEYDHTAPLVILDLIFIGSDEGFHAIWGR